MCAYNYLHNLRIAVYMYVSSEPPSIHFCPYIFYRFCTNYWRIRIAGVGL